MIQAGQLRHVPRSEPGKRCSFCGRYRLNVRGMVERGDVRVCSVDAAIMRAALAASETEAEPEVAVPVDEYASALCVAPAAVETETSSDPSDWPWTNPPGCA